MDTARPETTMIYAPPELATHRAAVEWLRRTGSCGRVAGQRLSRIRMG